MPPKSTGLKPREVADALPRPTPTQGIIAGLAIVGSTVLGAIGSLDPSAVSALYSAVLFGGIGHLNGYRVGKNSIPPEVTNLIQRLDTQELAGKLAQKIAAELAATDRAETGRVGP